MKEFLSKRKANHSLSYAWTCAILCSNDFDEEKDSIKYTDDSKEEQTKPPTIQKTGSDCKIISASCINSLKSRRENEVEARVKSLRTTCKMHNYKTGNSVLIGSIVGKVQWIIMNCKPNMSNQQETKQTQNSHFGVYYREHNLFFRGNIFFIKLRWGFAYNLWLGNSFGGHLGGKK